MLPEAMDTADTPPTEPPGKFIAPTPSSCADSPRAITQGNPSPVLEKQLTVIQANRSTTRDRCDSISVHQWNRMASGANSAQKRSHHHTCRCRHIIAPSEIQCLASEPIESAQVRCEALMRERRRILATGGAGYIGSHVVAELVAADCATVILDNFENGVVDVPKRLERIPGKAVTVVRGDLRDRALLTRHT